MASDIRLTFADALYELKQAHDREVAAAAASFSKTGAISVFSGVETSRREISHRFIEDLCPSEGDVPNERDGREVVSVAIEGAEDRVFRDLSQKSALQLRANSAGLLVEQLDLVEISKESDSKAHVSPDLAHKSEADPTSPGTAKSETTSFAPRSQWRSLEELLDTPGASTSRNATSRRVKSMIKSKMSQSMDDVGKNSQSNAFQDKPGFLWFLWRKLVSYPDATWRLCWDLLGTSLIGWDVIFIPLQAFEIPPSPFLIFMGWVITLFWTGDIVASFFVGFYKSGILIMRPGPIARHYLSTWFFLDVLVVAGDWLDTVGTVGEGLDVSKFGRVTRIIRTVRVIRLLRLLKLKKLLNDLQEHIYTEYAFILVTVVKLIIFILALNHFVACTWYFTGYQGGSNGWLETHFDGSTPTSYRYCTSLHWSLTQFMPASMEINPVNWVERVFAIIVIFMGMITFSSFVSSITSSMLSLRNLGAEDNKQLWLLRRFLKQRDVPFNLGLRVTTYLEYTCATQKKRIQETDIRLLSMLSQPLKDELHYELNVQHVREHPLFGLLCRDVEVVMHRLCRTALQPHSLASGDAVFDTGDEADRMYFFLRGGLLYIRSNGMPLEPPLQAGEWICEQALWTTWRHHGELQSNSETELLSIESLEFARCVGRSANAWVVVAEYAKNFLALLTSMDPNERGDVIRRAHFYSEVMEHIGVIVADKFHSDPSQTPEGRPKSFVHRMLSGWKA